MVGKDYSWWQASYALRAINGSIGQPNMINLRKGTTGFVLYGLTLHNAAKFHVKLTSSPAEGASPGVCDTEPYGKGYIVWGITLLTPSKWFNSAGYQLTPSWARNSDGVDPGTTDIAYCGVIACSTISTGDDQIAIKGGHWVENLTIAHMRFGTGHGMSIGSETYGSHTSPDGVMHRGVQNVHVYDLTIDADSRAVGHEAHARGLQRHPHQVRREPRRPGQQHHVRGRLSARHGERHPDQHRVQPAVRRPELPRLQADLVQEHSRRDLHGAQRRRS